MCVYRYIRAYNTNTNMYAYVRYHRNTCMIEIILSIFNLLQMQIVNAILIKKNHYYYVLVIECISTRSVFQEYVLTLPLLYIHSSAYKLRESTLISFSRVVFLFSWSRSRQYTNTFISSFMKCFLLIIGAEIKINLIIIITGKKILF